MMSIIMEGDGCWQEDRGRTILNATSIAVARLPRGMQSGKSSVTIRIELPDGQLVYADTSMELFLSAARAFRIREDMEATRHRDIVDLGPKEDLG